MKNKFYVTILSTIAAICLGICMDYITEQEKNTPVSAYSAQYEAIENKGCGWGFKKTKGAEPEIPVAQQEVLKKYNAFYIDSKRQKKLYLTFDEGYENGYTSSILDTLKEKNVPAAFFITAPYAKTQQELIKRMINEGHILGNHTVNHPKLPTLSDATKIASELNEMNELVSDMYGYEMKYMRPPEGEYSQRVLAVAKDLGFKTVLWSFAYRDWNVNAQKGRAYAINEVVPYFHDGAVLLLHAVSKDNAEALGEIIDKAREGGYEFASLDEISTEDNTAT